MTDQAPLPPDDLLRGAWGRYGLDGLKPITGGLSSARLWKCRSAFHGELALRRWPADEATSSRIAFVHQCLEAAMRAGITQLPTVYPDQSGSTLCRHEGYSWELTQWLPGQADYRQRPGWPRLENAMAVLAQLHRVWRSTGHYLAASPTVLDRIRRLRDWLSWIEQGDPLARLDASPSSTIHCYSGETIRQLWHWGRPILDELDDLQSEPVQVHPVAGDLHSEHVLFDGDRVTGFIDFGALRIDEPTTDLVRLLASFEPYDDSMRQRAIESYNQNAGGSHIMLQRFATLDRAACLLTSLQWMKWLAIDHKPFDAEFGRLLQRWREALDRLPKLGLDSNYRCAGGLILPDGLD